MNAYDFDDTLYDGHSAIDFLLGYIMKNPKSLKFAPPLLKTLFQYKRQNIRIDELKGKYAEMMEDYFAKEKIDLRPFVKDFWDKNEHRIKSFYKDIQQEDDLIITASPEFLMREICDRIGVKNLIASKFDPVTGTIEHACFREEKYHLFKEHYPDVVLEKFYTDSLNDKFMFPCAEKVYLVKGENMKRLK